MLNAPYAPPTPSVSRLADYNAQRIGFSAGVAAAAIMLIAIVLMRLLSGVPSLPEVLADGVLVLLPGALFSMVLDSLQHAAKPLFYAAVGIGMLIVGGFLGRWYGVRASWRQIFRIVVTLWLVFGVVIYTLLGAGIFGQHLQAGPIWHAVSLLVVLGVFGVGLHQTFVLFERRALPAPEGGPAAVSRRELLGTLGAGLLATVSLGAGWRALSNLGSGSSAGTRAPTLASDALTQVVPNAPPFDLKGLSPEVTPTKDFYTVSKNLIDPTVAVGGWRLKIDGLVETPMELTYEQLTALPASQGYYSLMCISNEVGGDLWGNAHWEGVKLKYLLEQAGVHKDGVKAMFSAADDYKDSVKLDRALHPDALLAWAMNGQPLATQHGFPARLLIPGIYGMKNVKWLNGITILSSDFLGYWQSQGWDDAAPYQTASRIDTPAGRTLASTGPMSVGGVAFAGDRGIQTVEVSTDAGQTWQAAQVKPGLSPYTWQLWRADLQLNRAVRSIQVRATDGLGHQQIRESAPPFPSGSTGYHSITIAVS